MEILGKDLLINLFLHLDPVFDYGRVVCVCRRFYSAAINSPQLWRTWFSRYVSLCWSDEQKVLSWFDNWPSCRHQCVFFLREQIFWQRAEQRKFPLVPSSLTEASKVLRSALNAELSNISSSKDFSGDAVTLLLWGCERHLLKKFKQANDEPNSGHKMRVVEDMKYPEHEDEEDDSEWVMDESSHCDDGNDNDMNCREDDGSSEGELNACVDGGSLLHLTCAKCVTDHLFSDRNLVNEVKFVLSSHSRLDIVPIADNFGRSALQLLWEMILDCSDKGWHLREAEWSAALETTDILLQSGVCPINHKDNDGRSLVLTIANSPWLDFYSDCDFVRRILRLFEKLHDLGADFNVVSHSGRSMFHVVPWLVRHFLRLTSSDFRAVYGLEIARRCIAADLPLETLEHVLNTCHITFNSSRSEILTMEAAEHANQGIFDFLSRKGWVITEDIKNVLREACEWFDLNTLAEDL